HDVFGFIPAARAIQGAASSRQNNWGRVACKAIPGFFVAGDGRRYLDAVGDHARGETGWRRWGFRVSMPGGTGRGGETASSVIKGMEAADPPPVARKPLDAIRSTSTNWKCFRKTCSPLARSSQHLQEQRTASEAGIDCIPVGGFPVQQYARQRPLIELH